LDSDLTDSHDIVVVGSGIAGLSAALAAARLGHRTLVLTGHVLGGHLLSIERIDGYPGFAEGVAGYDLCPTVQEQAAAAGADFEMIDVTRIAPGADGWLLDTVTGQRQARAVIVATGTRFKEIAVPGEVLLRGKGVSHCASCDAPLLRDKQVIVAGGGDSALQEALTLAEHCARVTIVHHGASPAAQAAYRELAEANERIAFVPQSEITEIVGDDAVTGVRIQNLVSQSASEIECAAAFVFIGLQPNAEFIQDKAVLDSAGRIVADDRMHSRIRGLLAAGTVRAGAIGRAAAASGEGTAVALAASRYLDSGEWPAD
jgi:thioredoxin reductase (NADPH)